MFYSAAKLLTLLSVLLHAGMGCCAHHDHCSVLNSLPSAVDPQESQDTHQCRCKFHAHCNAESNSENAGEDEPDHSSCPCGESHGNCTDHCLWLTNSKVELPADVEKLLPLAIADGWSLQASDGALIASGFSHCPPRLSELTDSMRARTQVWRL